MNVRWHGAANGVGNRRKELTKKTLGIPVVAIGVPTVVDAATIVNDTMESLIHALDMEDYAQKYQLIKENLVKENGLKVEDADIEGFAKRVAKAQFAQYGMLSVPEDVLANYAKDILKNKQTLQNIIDRAVEEKLAGWLKEQVELDTKEVTADEFNKLFEE